MGLQINVRQAGDVTILDLRGRATIGAGTEALSQRLRETLDGGAKKVLVNLGGAQQIDSTGISTLVRTFVTMGRSGGSLKLLNPTGRVREVLEVTRLLSSIPSFTDEQQALQSFR